RHYFVVRSKDDCASPANGIPGVDTEVHQDLFDLRGISLHAPHIRAQIEVEFDAGIDYPTDEGQEIASDRIDVAMDELEVASAREAEQALDELSGTFGGEARLFQMLQRLDQAGVTGC